MFVAQYYAAKLWTNHERESAQARAFEENHEYILPARFDDTEVPGLLRTIGYVNLHKKSPSELCELVVQKLREAKSREEGFPRHMLVPEDMNDDDRRQYAIFSATLYKGDEYPDLDIAIDPARYSGIGEILDDLFMHYLSENVKPYTYGSQWLVAGEPFDTRILAPWEWVRQPGRPVHQVAPSWGTSVTPTEAGVVPGSRWKLFGISDDTHELVIHPGMDRAYVIGCNSEDISRLILTNAKAVAFLKDAGFFRKTSLGNFKPHGFRHTYVFRAWLSICNRAALVDTGKRLTSKMKAMFRRF